MCYKSIEYLAMTGGVYSSSIEDAIKASIEDISGDKVRELYISSVKRNNLLYLLSFKKLLVFSGIYNLKVCGSRSGRFKISFLDKKTKIYLKRIKITVRVYGEPKKFYTLVDIKDKKKLKQIMMENALTKGE